MSCERQRNAFRREAEALAARIDNEALAAKKTGESHAHFAGEAHRKARARRNRSHDWNSSHRRLLNDFETATAAHNQDALSKWQAVLAYSPPDDFVDRVVAADVFALNEQRAVTIEQRGGVQSARP